MTGRLLKRGLGLLGPWCVLVLGLVATAFGMLVAVEAGDDEARVAAGLDADRMVGAIAARVQVHEQMLTSAAALFAASNDVTRQEWQSYVAAQNVHTRWPDIVSMGFAELVEAEHLGRHEMRLRAQGVSRYRLVPGGDRPLYLPLTYNEPDDDDSRAEIGNDVLTDSLRRHAAEQSIISGRPILSGPVSAAGRPGTYLAMFAPAIRAGSAIGVATSTLRIDQLTSLALDQTASDLSVRLYDSPLASDQFLIFDSAPGRARDGSSTLATRRFIAAGRAWSLEAIAAPGKPPALFRSMPLLVLMSGIAITGLAYLAACMLQRARMGERRFRDYAELATDWLWEHDRDLRFTFVSSTRVRRAAVAANAIGRTRREIAEATMDAEECALLDRFEAMMRAGRSFTGLEYSVQNRSGGREYFRISAKPVRGPDGEVQGYRGVTQVITGEKRREQELRQAKMAAEAASASKSRFLAMMSHELRTPLNAIIGFSDVITELRFGRKAIDRYAEYARIINRSGQQLLDLISQLLDMSKIEAGKLELVIETVDAAEIARDCLSLLHDRAAAGGVAMHDVFPAAGLRLSADRRALRQVVLNLVSNAVKFTPKGGTVTVVLNEDSDGAATFCVTDTGIGISPEAMKKIFEPFQQADATIARRFGGTGLGLAISRALVEAQGGTLTIASTVGQGTTATARFPPARTLRDSESGTSPPIVMASVAD